MSSRVLRGLSAALLAVLLLYLPAAASSAEEQRPAQAEQQQSGLTRGKKLWLVLGGTVAGVTGMWVGLYRRGKK